MAFPDGWTRKCKITIPDGQISGSHVNFAVLVTQDNLPIEMLDGGGNSALNGGGDVRFSEDSSGAIRLAVDIVSFVTGGGPDVEMHVKLPTLNTGAAKEIWVWYKKAGETQPAVGSVYGRNQVWSEDDAVFHCGDSVDSTGGADLTLLGVSPASGKMEFDNTNYAQRSLPSGLLGASNFSVRAIARHDKSEGWKTFCASSPSGWNWYLGYHGLKLHFNINGLSFDGTLDTTIGAIHYIAGNYNGATAELFLDGTLNGSHAVSGPLESFGSFGLGGDESGVDRVDAGLYDIIISSRSLGADFYTTWHRNQSSPGTFASAGTAQAVGGGVSLTIQRAVNALISVGAATSQQHNLMTNAAEQGHLAGNAVFSQGNDLVIRGGLQSVTSDPVSLTQNLALGINDAVHGQGADGLILSQGQLLIIDHIPHGLTSDHILLNQIQALVTWNATLGLMSDVAGMFDPLDTHQTPAEPIRP